VLAFGKEKVIGVNMPWTYSDQELIDSAMTTARQLDIKYVTVPIFTMADATEQAVNTACAQLGLRGLDDVQRGNMASKERTKILSNLAAANSGIFTNNGNKLELSIGYFTLDGDGRGAIAPLGSMVKFEEFELARYLNEEVFKREVIPYALIPDELCRWSAGQKPPTAELEKGQFDPMKFGYHCALLELMLDYKKNTEAQIAGMYFNGTLHTRLAERFEKPEAWGAQIMQRYGLDDPTAFIKDLQWFAPLTEGMSVAKRVQTPPNIALNKTDYGYDKRESIMPHERLTKFERLRDKILMMRAYNPRYDHAEAVA
jgi:NAD+ synthase (glutamine-hydrolysing)